MTEKLSYNCDVRAKLLTNLAEEQKDFFVWTYKLKVETGAISVYCIYLLMCAITR